MRLQGVYHRVRGATEMVDPLTHVPHLGKHTWEILGEMAYGVGELEKLTASGVVVCYRG